MKKTYVTNMPDHVGAFLTASHRIAALGMNITRVSYNKAIDVHTLFIEVEGTPEQIRALDGELTSIGYLQQDAAEPNVVLLEFRLPDRPGSVTEILELIAQFRFNISYMSSQGNGTDWQLFKMGLFVESEKELERFLTRASALCRVRRVNYSAERSFDNSIFYDTFSNALARYMDIDPALENELKIHINLAMQTLDERNLSPYTTFECISRFAELLSLCRGDRFEPRITRHAVTDSTSITVIEPPCGSNTLLLESGGQYLFVDTGYACYREEMLKIFRRLIPDFDTMEKTALITHADVDHCGLLNLFDRVYMSRRSAESLRLEAERKNAFREQNPLHQPYIQICKLLTAYEPVRPEKIVLLSEGENDGSRSLVHTGSFDFGQLHFEIYEGAGGHLKGEILLIDYDRQIALTGDVYVNLHGMTPQQAEYNRYAPVLMTSVDTDPALAAEERRALFGRLGRGTWSIYSSHGARKEYCVDASEKGERK